jgi:hypothetical protein
MAKEIDNDNKIQKLGNRVKMDSKVDDESISKILSLEDNGDNIDTES